jgi:hypothetical protein
MALIFDVASGDVGLSVFDLFPLSQYSFVATEVDVGWCDVARLPFAKANPKQLLLGLRKWGDLLSTT